jgi:predicted nuclease of predicted toxin-antitoxin system
MTHGCGAVARGALTKDEDFPRRWLRGDSTVRIVWLRIGNCSRRALAEWSMPQMPRVVARWRPVKP